MAADIPAVGTEAWERWSENLIRERDELKAAIRDINKDVRVIELEADLTNLQRRADNLRAICGNIVNAPKMSREDVQSRLLIATQRYDGM